MHVIRWDLLESSETKAYFLHILNKAQGTALTVGGFDGPHIGHQILFNSVLQNATSKKLVPGIVTFTKSPGAYKKPDHYSGDVSTLDLRLKKFAEYGFHFVILIDFSGDFGKMSGGVFFDILVKTAHMRYLAVGHDFRCGHRLDTGVAEIAALSQREGFRFDSIGQVEIDGVRVSSSAIRKAVQSADFTRAEKLLGYPFLLDFMAPQWTVTDRLFKASRSEITQILPQCGTYTAVLHTDACQALCANAEITETQLLIFPSAGRKLPDVSSVQAVEFRLSSC